MKTAPTSTSWKTWIALSIASMVLMYVVLWLMLGPPATAITVVFVA